MHATYDLLKQHDAILTMLGTLNHTSHHHFAGPQVRVPLFRLGLSFFGYLLTLAILRRKKLFSFRSSNLKDKVRSGRAIGVVLFEHGQGREFLRELAVAGSVYKRNPGPSEKRWVTAAEPYAIFL